MKGQLLMLDRYEEVSSETIWVDDQICVAMCPPHFISNKIINNAQMADVCAEYGTVDIAAAHQQFQKIYQEITKSARVYLMPALAGLQDQIYVSNVASILPRSAGEGPLAVLANFKAPARHGEERPAKQFLAALGFETLQCPHFFEGEADLKRLALGVYLGSTGMRTEAAALTWIAEQTGNTVIPCQLENPYLYHLDCCVLPFGENNALVVTEALDRTALKEIEKHTNIIDVPLSTGLAGATNCVVLDRTVLVDSNLSLFPSGSEIAQREKLKLDFLERLCAEYSKSLSVIDVTEFIKSGAAISCMTLRLSNN
ncbi:MAG: hypothetical protein GY762_00610 [Proteobacteria bacterium]|nr:hypothetical protein [Pseudomonadota bacterium]